MARILLILFLLIVGAFGLYGATKPLPAGVGVASDEYVVAADSVRLLTDRTYRTEDGERVHEQQIFDYILAMIGGAETYVLLDMFLFNDFLGAATSSYRALSGELTEVLIAKKASNPEIVLQVVTDPINSVYGGSEAAHLTRLTEVGVNVIVTDLTALRDSNPLYSAWWRSVVRHVPDVGGAWLPNVFDTTRSQVTTSAYLDLLNFKANHRKLIVADFASDDGARGLRTLVTSANPHDGSSEHSNVALVSDTALWEAAVASERAVADFSGTAIAPPATRPATVPVLENPLTIQLLTEGAIKDALLTSLYRLDAGDELALAMFYLSDRDVVSALKRADTRGVRLRLLLDPNRDAFGREKNGVPNRQVAHELMQHTDGNTQVRWCATSGEQCHSKLLIMRQGDTAELVLGSANFTRRNLDNYNLETNIRLVGSEQAPVIADTQRFFDEQWQNADGRQYSLSYEAYNDDSLLKTLYYRVGEFTGLSTY